MSSSSSNSEIDREALWGDYQNQMRRRMRMGEQLARKSLNLPNDEMQNVGNRIGLGWKELAIVVAGLIAAGFGMSALRPPPSDTTSPPADSAYEVRFFDRDGNLIDVPHVSESE